MQYIKRKWVYEMDLKFDQFEKDTLMDTLQYRLENDEHLLVNSSLEADIKDLLENRLKRFTEMGVFNEL